MKQLWLFIFIICQLMMKIILSCKKNKQVINKRALLLTSPEYNPTLWLTVDRLHKSRRPQPNDFYLRCVNIAKLHLTVGPPLGLFDYSSSVRGGLTGFTGDPPPSSSTNIKETSRKSSWLIQFPRFLLLEGVWGSREVTGKLNMTAPEEGMTQSKDEVRGWGTGKHFRLRWVAHM